MTWAIFPKLRLPQKRALALNPDLVAALNNLGSIARDKEDCAGAISFYRRVLELRPGYLESVNNLISVLIESEALEEARESGRRLPWQGA